MKIEWDVPIAMDDGVVLRADVFRPEGEGRFPAILSYGPYGKGLAFQDGYRTAWEIMARENPDALAGSSNRYQNWEVVDPEKWVPDGYAVVRVDNEGRCTGSVQVTKSSCRRGDRGWRCKDNWRGGALRLICSP